MSLSILAQTAAGFHQSRAHPARQEPGEPQKSSVTSGGGEARNRTRAPSRRERRVMSRDRPDRRQSGYSSFRQVRGSASWAFGVRSSSKLKYGATNGSGAVTVEVW